MVYLKNLNNKNTEIRGILKRKSSNQRAKSKTTMHQTIRHDNRHIPDLVKAFPGVN